MSEKISRQDTGYQTCILRIQSLESKVEYMEHLHNQQSILVNTLGDIMAELKKQEHFHGTTREI